MSDKTLRLKGPIVFLVLEKDNLGRPSLLQVGYDDTTFELQGGEEFITGALDPSAFEPEVKGNA